MAGLKTGRQTGRMLPSSFAFLFCGAVAGLDEAHPTEQGSALGGVLIKC